MGDQHDTPIRGRPQDEGGDGVRGLRIKVRGRLVRRAAPDGRRATALASATGSINGRVTHHAGYALSMRRRMPIEKVFGWTKTTGTFRRTRFRGRERTSFAAQIVTAAYNILRITRLSLAPAV